MVRRPTSIAYEELTSYGVYHRTHHVDVGLRAGLSHSQLAVIRDTSTALSDDVDPLSVLSEAQRACLIYADWMTRNVKVPKEVFLGVRAGFNEQNVVEITGTVACYNMVSRILLALDVGDMEAVPVPEVHASN